MRRSWATGIAAGPWLALAMGLGLLLGLAVLPGEWGAVYGQTVPGGGGDDSGNTGDGDDSEDACVNCGTVGEGGDDTFQSDDGRMDVGHTGGNPVEVFYDQMDEAAPVPLPGAPVMLTDLELQPNDTPNYVNVVLLYTDEELAGLLESSLRVFYYDVNAGKWVELPIIVDPIANTITIVNIDVSAFANGACHIGIF